MAVAAAAACCAGCLFPHFHTERPGLTFEVVDESGAPIPHARVLLHTSHAPSSRVQSTEAYPGDADGRAHVERDRSLHLIFIPFPDAEAPKAFAWCVEADGYLPEARYLKRQDPHTILVFMHPSVEHVGCDPSPASMYDFPGFRER